MNPTSQPNSQQTPFFAPPHFAPLPSNSALAHTPPGMHGARGNVASTDFRTLFSDCASGKGLADDEVHALASIGMMFDRLVRQHPHFIAQHTQGNADESMLLSFGAALNELFSYPAGLDMAVGHTASAALAEQRGYAHSSQPTAMQHMLISRTTTNLFNYLAILGHPNVPQTDLPISPEERDASILQDMQRTYLSEVLDAIAALAAPSRHGAHSSVPAMPVLAPAPEHGPRTTRLPEFTPASAQRGNAMQAPFPPAPSTPPFAAAGTSTPHSFTPTSTVVYWQGPPPLHASMPQPQAQAYPSPGFLPSSALPYAHYHVHASAPGPAAPLPDVPVPQPDPAFAFARASGQPQPIVQGMPPPRVHAHPQPGPASDDPAPPRKKKEGVFGKLMKKLSLSSGPSNTSGSPPMSESGASDRPTRDEVDSWESHSDTEGDADKGQPARISGHEDFGSDDGERHDAAMFTQGSGKAISAIALASMLTDDAIPCTKDELIAVLRDVPNAKANKLAVIARMLGFIEASMVATPAELVARGVAIWRGNGWSTSVLRKTVAYLCKQAPHTSPANLLGRLIQYEIRKRN